MDSTDMENKFDTIVIGTGLVESILAAALSRVGKSVLHLDQNNHYGSDWTTLTPRDFSEWESKTNKTGNTQSQSHAPFKCSSKWNYNDEDRCLKSYIGKQKSTGKEMVSVMKQQNNTKDSRTKFGQRSILKSRIPKLTHESIGELVETESFGIGVITGCQRNTGMFIVSLDWELSNGTAARIYCLPTKLCIVGQDTQIKTLHGNGTIHQVHQPIMSKQYQDFTQGDENNTSGDMYEIKLTNWTLANQRNPTLFVSPCTILKSLPLAKRHKRYRARQRSRGPTPNTVLEHVFHNNRTYQLDLSPHLIFSGGLAVDVLVRSGVHEYVEFLPLDDMYIASNNVKAMQSTLVLKHVPCSKADVFKTTSLTMLDKRILMKFLRFVSDINETQNVLGKNERQLGKGRSLTRPQNAPTLAYPDYEQYMNGTMEVFYERCGMSKRLQSIVTHAIGFVGVKASEISTKNCLVALQKTLNSLGKYGKSPFLCTKYGNSELPQAFCRLCAVYGGVYMLRVGIDSFAVTESISDGDEKYEADEYVTGVIMKDGKKMLSKNVIVAPEYISCMMKKTIAMNKNYTRSKQINLETETTKDLLSFKNERLCRCILITNQTMSNVNVEKCIVVIPPNEIDNERTISIVQLSSQVSVVPPNKYVVHLSTSVTGSSQDGEAVLRRAVDQLYGATNHGTKTTDVVINPLEDSIEWSSYFYDGKNMTEQEESKEQKQNEEQKPVALPKHVYCRQNISTTNCGAPVDIDVAFHEAKRLFVVLCPNEKFLPERPDPNAAQENQENEHANDGEEEDVSDLSGLDDSDDDYGV